MLYIHTKIVATGQFQIGQTLLLFFYSLLSYPNFFSYGTFQKNIMFQHSRQLIEFYDTGTSEG